MKAESPVKLFNRDDGSYMHPSPSSTAEHCIEFWSNVSIPDEIIAQVESAYYNDRVAEINEDMKVSMDDWSNAWAQVNQPPEKAKYMDAHNQRFRDEHETYRLSILAEVESRRPARLGKFDSRQIIRAYQMALNRPAPERFPGEEDKVFDHEVELFDETLTVEEVELKYRIDRIKGYVLRLRGDGSQAAVLEAAEETNSLLETLNENLVHMRLEAREKQEY